MRTITHWIGGKPEPGTSTRTGTSSGCGAQERAGAHHGRARGPRARARGPVQTMFRAAAAVAMAERIKSGARKSRTNPDTAYDMPCGRWQPGAATDRDAGLSFVICISGVVARGQPSSF